MNTENQYSKAFNDGYILAKHEPNLLNIISKNLVPSNNYLQGFFKGKSQYKLENNTNQLVELGELRSKSKFKHNDFERGY